MLCPYCHTTVAIAITTLYQHHHCLCTTAVANSLFDPINFLCKHRTSSHSHTVTAPMLPILVAPHIDTSSSSSSSLFLFFILVLDKLLLISWIIIWSQQSPYLQRKYVFHQDKSSPCYVTDTCMNIKFFASVLIERMNSINYHNYCNFLLVQRLTLFWFMYSS